MSENGSYYYLPCSQEWINDTYECMIDMEGTRYEKKYYNTMKLQTFINKVMEKDGIMIHIHW